MIFDHYFKIQFDASVAMYRENLPWILIGLAIAFGTLVFCVVFYYFGNKIFSGIKTKAWAKKNDEYIKKTRQRRKNYGRLVVLVLTIIFFLGGMTCAASIVGVNLLSIILGYGVLLGVAMQMFGTQLHCLGSYLSISFSDKFEEGQWWKLPKMNFEGLVVEINILWVTMQYINEKCEDKSLLTMQIPTNMFIVTEMIRDTHREQLVGGCFKPFSVDLK